MRDQARLELVTEAVRAVPEEVARTVDHLRTGLVDEDWGRRYGRAVRLGKNPTRPRPLEAFLDRRLAGRRASPSGGLEGGMHRKKGCFQLMTSNRGAGVLTPTFARRHKFDDLDG
ncbi:regulator of G-protein signaling domain-containing protein [Streptomyces fagopyri]|uniref:hypothetical protein n=1 Tax=Streptomyces fagopyri TaxID=2662397 RepID=UPI0038150966